MSGGRRIKLDLTDFVKDAGGQRWMFVSRDDFSTISDVVDRLREEHQQLGQHHLVTLLLDNFTLPPWESVELLQSGDLVKVCRTKLVQDKTSSVTKPQTSSQKIAAKKTVSSSSDTSSSEEEDKTPTVSKSLTSSQEIAAKKTVSSSSDTSSSEEEEDGKDKSSKVSSAPRKKQSSSSSSSSDSSNESKKISPKRQMFGQLRGKRKAAETSSSSDSSDSSSDSEKPASVRPSMTAKPKDSSSESSEDSSESEKEEKQTKMETNKSVVVANIDAGQGSMFAKPRRKRKRKNKNKNKLAPEDAPVFEAEILPTSYDLNNHRKSNAHVKFDEQMEVDESVEPQHTEEFTVADVRKLYEQSVSSRPAEKSVPAAFSPSNSVKLVRVDNSSSGCEAALIKQFDEKKVSNNQVVTSSTSNFRFKPRVLSVKEMAVKTTRKEPLTFSNGVGSSNSDNLKAGDDVRQANNIKEADNLSQFSALLNCAGKVFDKNAVPVKDYTAYHLVSDSGPRVGDVIAFKHLDLGENYTPELSDYKEGKVLEVDENQSVVFEMITKSNVKKNGRFEMEENQSIDDEKLKRFSWNELIEPRLIFP